MKIAKNAHASRYFTTLAMGFGLLMQHYPGIAQEIPIFTGCLTIKTGQIYNLAAGPEPSAPCELGDVEITLSGLQSLIGVEGIDLLGGEGKATVGINPTFQLPQGCQPGELAVFQQGAWVCLDPDTLASPRNPVNKVWVAPYWDSFNTRRSSGGLVTIDNDIPRIRILNPGDEVANVTCLFSSDTGAILFGDTRNLSIPPGRTDTCVAPFSDTPGRSFRLGGWMLLHSDQPVLPHAEWRIDPARRFLNEGRGHMTMYPIDCKLEGVEFLCAFVPPERR